ncbi:Hypothetical predicted protein [Olea europaea subsp. europaea]|uniref:Uncharacterized protein n=1 Tax=Olea europaea subsp. europaea TaxID=158383 RepID=A0A8S0RBC5_OLEEU|nr:Hypothetical predicted protein [Olea europaea subsp. europaea]
MGIGIDLGTFFQSTYSINDRGMENIFDFINASIAVAAKEKPKEFLARRSRIIEALLMASPMDDIDQDCSISSSSNFSCESPLDEDVENQFDGVTSAPSKPINLVAKEKGCGRVFDFGNDLEQFHFGIQLMEILTDAICWREASIMISYRRLGTIPLNGSSSYSDEAVWPSNYLSSTS